MQRETHVAPRLSTTATTHHGVLDSAAPPAAAGADLVADQRKVGLLQLAGQAATSYTRSNGKGKIRWALQKKTKHLKPTYGYQGASCHQLTGSKSPSGDVAEVVVGQDLARTRQRAQLDMGVQNGVRGQTQQGDVVPEVLIHVSNRRNSKQLGKDT